LAQVKYLNEKGRITAALKEVKQIQLFIGSGG
jgi:hypothetical protein